LLSILLFCGVGVGNFHKYFFDKCLVVTVHATQPNSPDTVMTGFVRLCPKGMRIPYHSSLLKNGLLSEFVTIALSVFYLIN